MDLATVILLVIQSIIGVVLLAGVPWAMTVQSRLAGIDAILRSEERSRMNSDKEHEEFDTRIRAIEIQRAACPVCNTAIKPPPKNEPAPAG